MKESLGDLLGVKYNQINRYLTGESDISFADAIKIAEFLKVDLAIISRVEDPAKVDPRRTQAHALIDQCDPNKLDHLLTAISLVVPNSQEQLKKNRINSA